MKGWGIVLLVGGLIVAAFSLSMETTISTSTPSVLGYGLSTSSTVHNLGLLQQQMMVFVFACAVSVAGVALLAAGSIEGRLVRPAEAAPDAQARPEGVPERAPRPRTPEDQEAEDAASQRFFHLLLAAGTAVFVVILAIAWSGTHRTSEGAAIEANAEALADNLEMQADNLEALAGNTVDASQR